MKRMKKKEVLIAVLVLSILLFCVACTQSSPAPAPAPAPTDTQQPAPAAAPAETFVWDLLDTNIAGHIVNNFYKDWAEAIYQKSDGRLKINVRSQGELPFTSAEFFDAASSGSAQIAGCMVTPTVGFLDEAGLTSGCFMITNLDEFNKVMDILEPYLEKTMANNNLMNIFTIAHYNQYLYGKGTAPSSIADIKGMLIRTSGAEQAKFWQAVGLKPISMDSSEVMSALSKNVINGIITNTFGVESNKYYEALDWQYAIKSQWLPIFTVVNLDAFNALPADIQQIMIETTEELLPTFHQDMDKEYADSVKRVGEFLETVTATPEEEAELRQIAAPLWEAHAQSIGGDAPKVVEEIKKALNL